jgi:hypothetical protein
MLTFREPHPQILIKSRYSRGEGEIGDILRQLENLSQLLPREQDYAILLP